MTRFIIIRHGITDWNSIGKMQGISDAPLSEEGRTQAEKLSKRLKEESIDVAYTSMLQRAYDTAEKVLSHHPHVSLSKTPILNEMSWGEWEGRDMADIDKDLESREEPEFHFAPPGGESLSVLKKRITPFAEILMAMHLDQTVLIAAHNDTNRVMLGIILGWDEEKISETSFENTSVTIVHVDGDDRTLHLFDCSEHLKDL